MAANGNENITVKNVLFEYVMNPKYSFYWYHNPRRINNLNPKNKKEPVKIIKKDGSNFLVIHKHLHDFFKATLDEVRLKEANKFATFALNIPDNGLLAYFREAVSKREFGADVDFKMQRDHATHTLYNYILGWYFFDCSKVFLKAFRTHLKNKRYRIYGKNRRKLFKLTSDERDFYKKNRYGNIHDESIVLANEFGDVWSITSLLHDIGYILEGTISSASVEVENVRVSRGSKLIHDYFNHRFWHPIQIDFRAVQSIAAVLRVSVPDFKRSQSLSSLGDHLCNIGFCENIRENLEKLDGFNSLKGNEIEAIIKKPDGLNRSAFSLWETYYKVYADSDKDGKSNMERILKIVKKEYNDAIWKGSNQGYRNLNHGVCSGLIALKALSFFYDFVYGFQKLDKWDDYSNKYKELTEQGHLNEVDKVSDHSYAETKSFITNRCLPEQIKLRNGPDGRNADFWFDKVLWATASVAIHDVIQQKYYETICRKHDEKTGVLKIRIQDDPLAFLGVLVDRLQEWDRYTVLGESAFTDTEPLQSTEVEISFESKARPIQINYPKKNGSKGDFSSDIQKVLNGCLDGWEELVTCAEKLLCPHCGEPLEQLKIELTTTVVNFRSLTCGYVIENGQVKQPCNNIM